MKKIIIGLLLGFTVSVSQAALTIVNPSNVNFVGYDGEPATITGTLTSGQWGFLSASTAGIFSATYFGNESGFDNLYVTINGQLLETNSLGSTISTNIEAGTVPFAFTDSNGGAFVNGDSQTPVLGFSIIQGQENQYGDFDYILGFNDSFDSDADYDDFVVGVKFVAAAVPEPETYAMMMIGLAMIGFTARRNKKN
jgi:PEP-CTERM motif